jgi:hypothetical protein
MTDTGRRVVLAAIAAVLVGVVCWVALVLGPRLAIPDETGRAVDVAPVVVTPAPTPSPASPTDAAAPTPAVTPSASPTDSGGAAVVPGPDPVEVGDDTGGGSGRDDDTGGGSGRDHPEDD